MTPPKFALHITMGNDAMLGTDDIADAIERCVIPKLREGQYAGAVRDHLGNTVGRYDIAPEN